MRGSAAAVLAVAGCGSLNTVRTAEPAPAGQWRAEAALDVGSYRDRQYESTTPAAHVEVSLRRGVGYDTDVTLRAFVPGVELGVQRRVSARAWQVAVAAAAGVARTRRSSGATDALYPYLRTTALVTRRTSECWAWTLGPVVTSGLFVPAGGGWSHGVLTGAFVNVERSFGGAWSVVPELSLHVTAWGEVPVRGSVAQLAVALGRRW